MEYEPFAKAFAPYKKVATLPYNKCLHQDDSDLDCMIYADIFTNSETYKNTEIIDE